MPYDKEYTQCIICNRPLGQESKDLEWPVCHEHRKCSKCTCGDVSVKEARFCIDNEMPICHAKCMSVKDAPTLALQIEIANFTRLGNSITMRLPEATFEEKYVFLRFLQNLASDVSLLINKDKKALNQQLTSEKQAKAAKQADEKKHEVAVKAPQVRKHKTLAAKAIEGLTSIGLKYSQAAQTILAQELKKPGMDAQKARLVILEAMESLGTPKEDAPQILDGMVN